MAIFKGWRTVLVNGLTIIVAAAAWPEVVQLVDPQVLLLLSAGSNVLLRLLTTTKVGSAK